MSPAAAAIIFSLAGITDWLDGVLARLGVEGLPVIITETGWRHAGAGDEGVYPDDDLKASLVEGQWRFTHKDGTPY